MINRYLKNAHISESKFRAVLQCFSQDFSASQTSSLTNISRNTINGLFAKFRLRILDLTTNREGLSGEVEVDESYFGARRVRGKILEKSTIYTDGWKSYDGLITSGYKHYRIHHSENEFARGKNHVNGIESFWSYTKRRLLKFNGIHKIKFLLHLKESEFRWNMRINGVNMYQELLKNFREKSL